jgi:hypothetical protein
MGETQFLSRAKEFIYKNARLLDRKRYEYHYEGGLNEEVILLDIYTNRKLTRTSIKKMVPTECTIYMELL